MLRLFISLSILLIATYLGLSVAEDPGYVLIGYHTWQIETPLWVAVVLLLMLFLLGHQVLRFLNFADTVVNRLQVWNRERHIKDARLLTNRGLMELTEGHWEKAERYLLRAAKYSDNSLINYLAAARAAQEQNNEDRRDDYLRMAHKVMPAAEVAIGLTQAQLQLKQRQHEQALATLHHLLQVVPHHPVVLDLLQGLYVELGDWSALQNLLPDLRKYHVLSEKKLQALETEVYQTLLKSFAEDQKTEQLNSFWKQIPRRLRWEPVLVKDYVQALCAAKQEEQAEAILAETLSKRWDTSLVTLYGKVTGAYPERQLATAESWLPKHVEEAELLLTVGRLCVKTRLWGKARSYLETSLSLKPQCETYVELAHLMEQLSEQTKALNFYKQALATVLQ